MVSQWQSKKESNFQRFSSDNTEFLHFGVDAEDGDGVEDHNNILLREQKELKGSNHVYVRKFNPTRWGMKVIISFS